MNGRWSPQNLPNNNGKDLKIIEEFEESVVDTIVKDPDDIAPGDANKSNEQYSCSIRRFIEKGAVKDVILSLRDAPKSHHPFYLGSGKETPFTLASSCGQRDVMVALLKFGFSRVNECNRYGQSGLHCAIKSKHIDCVECLLDFGADLCLADCYGNQPLHYAAKHNCVPIMKLLCCHASRKMNVILLGVTTYDGSIDGIISLVQITPLFHKYMQKKKCKHFCLEFTHDVAQDLFSVHHSQSTVVKGLSRLPRLTRKIIDHVLVQYDTELSGYLSKKRSGSVWVKTIPSPSLLSKVLHTCFQYASVNPINTMKSTPLHLACQEKNIEAIKFLAESTCCLFTLKDICGKTVLDHAYANDASEHQCDEDLNDMKTMINYHWTQKDIEDDIDALKRFGMLLNRTMLDLSTIEDSESMRRGVVKDADVSKYGLSPFPNERPILSPSEMQIEQAWYCIMNLSTNQSKITFRDGQEWVEYMHEESGETFYYCTADKGTFSLNTPKRHTEYATISPICSAIEVGDLQQKHAVSLLPKLGNSIDYLEYAFARCEKRYFPCRLGCGCFVKIGRNQSFHEKMICPKRIQGCSLGCLLSLPEESWARPINNNQNAQQWHQQNYCPKRRIPCPFCREYVQCDELARHKSDLCSQRPATKVGLCTLGCGKIFRRTTVIEMQKDRELHEQSFCSNRIVACEWKECSFRCKESDMTAHVENHIIQRGIKIYDSPGTYKYPIPQNTTELLIRLWGAGGGSAMNDRANGSGGGGGFVEGRVQVATLGSAKTELIICVGSGGHHGSIQEQVDACGNRAGHSMGSKWAGGFGGEYSAVLRNSQQVECSSNTKVDPPLLIAGGGGGGGRRNGEPGGVNLMPLPELSAGNGEGGGQFLYPGISRGGIGGKSYIDNQYVQKVTLFPGEQRQPGGYKLQCITSVVNRIADNSITSLHGEGGKDRKGICGCVEIGLPQYFKNIRKCDDD